MRQTEIYIKLRASGYTIAEAARLLGLPLRHAWALERLTAEDIQTEAALRQLKQQLKQQ